MATRKALSKKTRFEVFKRDGFACQYCGASAPGVVLHVDHIKPVANGGDNSILNLVTSCQPCNSGKSDREISDQSALGRQLDQVRDLQERKEQIDMLLHWRDSLADLEAHSTQKIIGLIESHMSGSTVNESGAKLVKAWIKKFGLQQVLDGVDACSHKTSISNEEYFSSIPRYCAAKMMPDDQQKILYARGILRNKGYCNERLAISVMREAVDAGYDPESLSRLAKESRSWTAFRNHLEEFING